MFRLQLSTLDDGFSVDVAFVEIPIAQDNGKYGCHYFIKTTIID